MFKPCLLSSTVAAALALGLAPAAAQASAPLALTLPSAMPLATIGAAQINCAPAGESRLVQPSAPLTQPSPVMSKSAAILGGQMSALERLKLQQAGASATQAPSASLAPALSLAGSAIPVAAVGFTCPSALRGEAPATGTYNPRRSGAFLGTERVKIGRTRFDPEWKRVANANLSQRDLTNTIGAVAADREDLLADVNRWVNRSIRYQSDNGRDHWARASETLRKRAGDCEDYAILKMQLLAAAGIDKDDMMLTLARDTLRRVDHAVLLVKHGREWVMLDMQSDRVAPASVDYGYRPVMSFAGNARYLHGQRYQPPVDQRPVRLARVD